MRNLHSLALAAIFSGVWPVACPAQVTFYPHDAEVVGKPIGDWSKDWFEWALNLDAAGIIDERFHVPPNRLDSINNDGPVYFVPNLPTFMLAPERTEDVLVPIDTPLLINITSSFYIRSPEPLDANDLPVWFTEEPAVGEPRPAPEEWMKTFMDEYIDGWVNTFSYNGMDVDDAGMETFRHAIQTELTFPEGLPFDTPGTWPGSVVDGYWVMVEPMERGEVLDYVVTDMTPGNEQYTLTMRLTAVPEPASLSLAGLSLVALGVLTRRPTRRVPRS